MEQRLLCCDCLQTKSRSEFKKTHKNYVGKRCRLCDNRHYYRNTLHKKSLMDKKYEEILSSRTELVPVPEFKSKIKGYGACKLKSTKHFFFTIESEAQEYAGPGGEVYPIFNG